MTHNEFAESSFALETWLAPVPRRRILLITASSAAASDKIEHLIQDIRQHDSQALANRSSEQNEILVRIDPASFELAESFSLPHESGQFDLAICDHASTALAIEPETLSEIKRVVKTAGHLLISDYVVPGSRLRGKKARQSREAGEYVNTWMRLRNPRHKNYLAQDAWERRLKEARWDIQQTATRADLQAFDSWSDGYALTDQDRTRLRAMLIQAPEKVERFLTPLGSGDRIAFRLTELTMLAAA